MISEIPSQRNQQLYEILQSNIEDKNQKCINKSTHYSPSSYYTGGKKNKNTVVNASWMELISRGKKCKQPLNM